MATLSLWSALLVLDSAWHSHQTFIIHFNFNWSLFGSEEFAEWASRSRMGLLSWRKNDRVIKLYSTCKPHDQSRRVALVNTGLDPRDADVWLSSFKTRHGSRPSLLWMLSQPHEELIHMICQHYGTVLWCSIKVCSKGNFYFLHQHLFSSLMTFTGMRTVTQMRLQQ